MASSLGYSSQIGGDENSDPAALGGAAAVVGDRGDVADERHLEAGGLEGAERALPAGAGAGDEDGDGAHAVLLGTARRLLRRELRGEGGRLARALEAARAGARPGHGVAIDVGDR